MLTILDVTSNQFVQMMILGAIVFLGILAIGGFVTLVQGVRGIVLILLLKRRGLTVMGEVTHIFHDGRFGTIGGLAVPTVRFTAFSGQAVVFTSGHRGLYQVGQRLQVRYLQENPKRAELPEAEIFSGRSPTLFEKTLIGALLFPIGSIFFIKVLLLIFSHA